MRAQSSNKKKMHTQKELSRLGPSKSGDLVKIICEGAKTEINYFKEFCKTHRLRKVEAIHSGSTDPISIVEYALSLGRANDKIFCVFDHDDREDACNKAISRVKKSNGQTQEPKYRVILSTPSIEIWFLLHYSYTSKPLKAADILRELRRHFPNYEKNMANIFDHLRAQLPDAITNAKKLKAENEKTGSNNPATDVHELMEYLLSFAQT